MILSKQWLKAEGKKALISKKILFWGIGLLRGLLIFGMCYIILFPFVEKIMNSFMSQADLFDSTVRYVPRTFTFETYRQALDILKISPNLWHSVLLSLTVALLQTVSCTFVSYGFARFKTWFSSLLFGLVIFTLLVPAELILSPLYLQFRFFLGGINLLNSVKPFVILSLTCMGIKNGLFIYMLRQFFRGMPNELEEAAYVDGYGVYRTFFYIMMPNALPMMATVFLFSFAWQWTDTLYSGTFNPGYQTLATAVASSAGSVSWSISVNVTRTTAVLLVIVPLLFVYLVCQKAFIQSVERSGLVG